MAKKLATEVPWLRAERKFVKLWNNPRRGDPAWQRDYAAAIAALRATGEPWLMVKEWRYDRRKFTVDYELRDEWLETLNDHASRSRVSVNSVCAGHPHGVSGHGNYGALFEPHVCFGFDNLNFALSVARRLSTMGTDMEIRARNPVDGERRCTLLVGSSVYHSGRNQGDLAKWWEKFLLTLKEIRLSELLAEGG